MPTSKRGDGMERELQKDPALSRAGPQNLPPLTQKKYKYEKLSLEF